MIKELVDVYKQKGAIHHAYCIVGGGKENIDGLKDFLFTHFKINFEGNPDMWLRTVPSFGIDDSRDLVMTHSSKSFSSNKKIFIISTSSIAHEAQNALLKIFEEPSQDTHIFLIVPSQSILLPTLLSRMIVVGGQAGVASGETLLQVKKFIKSSVGERLEIIKPLIEEKNRQEISAFIDTLCTNLLKDKPLSKVSPELLQYIDDICIMKARVGSRSPSFKLILEHLATTLPKV